MAAVFALIILAITAIAFSVVLEKDVVDMLPFTVFSIILYLYFFYCVNLLDFGITSLFFLIAAFIIYAAKKKKNIIKKITPPTIILPPVTNVPNA